MDEVQSKEISEKEARAVNKYWNTKRYNDYIDYKDQLKKTKDVVRKAQSEFERKLMKDFKTNPKPLYKDMREIQKVKTGISQLIDDNGNMTDTDKKNGRCPQQLFPVSLQTRATRRHTNTGI